MDEVLPSFQIMIAAEVLVSMQGIVFFLIFGLQRRLYLEWRMLFTRRAARRSAIKLVNRRQSQSPKAIQRDLDYKSTNSWGRSISGVLLSPTKLRDSIPNMEMSDVPDSYPDSNRLTEISVLSDYVYAEEYIDDRPQLEPPSNMLDMPAGSTATSSTLSNGERSLQAPSDIVILLHPYSRQANTNHIHLIPRQLSDIYNNNHDNNNNYSNYNNYNHYNYNYNYSNNDSDDIENRCESMEDGRYESTRMNRSFSASSRGPMFVGLARAVSQQFNESDGNQQRVRTPPNAYPMP
ncbi:hypothetical protein BDF19DRAFT_420546 [Syncephalis fuscata]|nr:hypothetical protein BDF19DRAFT_420546 [Syncephalis fuscata]